MCNIKVTVAIDRPYSRYWGNYSAHATVTAEVTNRDGTHIAWDCTQGRASGCGYAKTSAALNHAFNGNKVLQTFALWKGFVPTGDTHAHDYGYTYDFRRSGELALAWLMRANSFEEHEVRGRNGDTVTLVYTRGDLPESFTKLF